MLYAFAQGMERTAVGWFVLDTTGSVFLTALAWAVRSMPFLVFGPLAGAMADRYSRRLILVVNSLLRAAAVLGLGLVALDAGSITELLALVALTGTTMTIQLSASQSLAGELAGPGGLPSAVGLLSFGQRSLSAAGALAGGFLIAAFGAGTTFLFIAVPLVLGALAYATVAETGRARTSTRLSADILEGIRVVFRVRIVGLLLALMIAVEILGFSFNALLPAVAERLLGVGPEGLGILMSAASIGSMAGTAFLTAAAGRLRQGRLLLWVIVSFGVLLVLLALSRLFALSILVVCGIGAMASMVDALEWMLLQANVDTRLRGRVLGAWTHAIGWGFLGPLVLGLLAERVGVANALALSGVLLVLTGAVTALRSRALRRA